MGKMKVHELAKELNLSNNEIIGKLKSMGIEVKSHLSTLSDEEYSKYKNVANSSKDMTEPKKSSDSKKVESAPHIIRRNVKVINTDEGKKEIEEITTNISGEIKKSHQTVVAENRPPDNSYSKEGLGVVTPKFSNSNTRGFSHNRSNNVVVTRNGIKVEDEVKKEVVKSVEKEDVENNNMNVAVEKEKIDVVEVPETKSETTSNYVKKPYLGTNTSRGDRPQYNNNNNTNNASGDRPQYNNNSNYERRPYNNNNTNTTPGDRPQYNNNNSNYERRPYNNNTNTTSGDRPQYNNNSNYERRPYNNNTNTTPGDRPQYNNNSNYERRPYNNNNTNTTPGDRPQYNNNNSNYERRPYNNNNTNTTPGDRPQYNNNNSNYERRPYNNNNTNTTPGDRPQYNNNNSNYERRPYNNNNTNTIPGDRPQYNNNNSNYERRPYNNNNTSTTPGSRPPYNNNNSNYERRPYNNNNTNTTTGSRPPYNNNNSGGGYRNNRFNSTPMNQVDKFMKQSTDNQPIEQKETRDYSLTLIDKKKYNNTPASVDGKKSALNKNDLRDQNTRVETSKLKGLEVNSSGSMIDLYERNTDSVRRTNRKRRDKRILNPNLNQTKIIPMTEVKLPETMTVKELAEAIKKQASELIKKLFSLGILATVNQEIDFDTAFLIAAEFGITAEKYIAVTEEDILFDESEDLDKDMKPRPPIVVVMGHVDHGKTSLLDRIRSAHVVTGEAGGITQHIGAYKVEINNKQICFLDTPGHEAFTEMRARGAHITDIAVIVVAADDGIKPQTIEAIDHAKAAGVSIIVAINKIDKPTANVDKVKQELLEVGLISEEWGGDTICVPISAMTGEGVDNLLEMILLTAEMKELKANPNKQAKGTVIEAKLDKNTGTITSLLVQRGTLNVGDMIVVGDIIGKVRAMKDDKGKKVKSAGPSTPVEILGLGAVPQTGDVFYEVEDEKTAKQLVSKRKADVRRNLVKQGAKVTLEDLFGQIKEGQIKDLNIIVKADVQGTLEALKNSLEKIANEEVKVKIIHASTGGIKESDVTLASVSNAIIIGFNVRPESTAVSQAEKEKVDLRLYSVIYDAINDIEAAMKGMLKPTFKEVVHGTAEVRATFKVSNVGTIAGCYVKSGSIIRNTMCRIIRESIVITEAKLESVKREKEDVKEVREGYECGIKLEKFNDINDGDIIECYEMVEEKRK